MPVSTKKRKQISYSEVEFRIIIIIITQRFKIRRYRSKISRRDVNFNTKLLKTLITRTENFIFDTKES